jgi:Fic family protein
VPFRPGSPFNDLPLLPPSVNLETPAVLKTCIAARAALAELDAVASLFPNRAILINALAAVEARASSEIEKTVREEEVWRYVAALQHGTEVLTNRPLTITMAVDVCSRLLSEPVAVRGVAETVLDRDGVAIYTPPEGAALEKLIANWERFLEMRDELDPLVRMAVAHFQFQALHPFEAANGRTARLLNVLVLIQQGLLHQPVLCLSTAILRTRGDYSRMVLDVCTRQQWEPGIIYLLRAIAETARWTTAKVRAIGELMKTATALIQAEAPKYYTPELIELVFEQPHTRIAAVTEAGIAQRQTASVYLTRLVELGVLESRKTGRDKVFIHRALLDLLASEDHSAPAYRSRKR